VPAPSSGGASPCAPGRATLDRPDDSAEFQIKVFYVLPRDGSDRGLDTNGTIARSVSAFDRWLRSQTGGAGLRFDRCAGRLDVGFAVLAKSDSEIAARGAFVREEIQAGLSALGFHHPRKLYLAYYDGSSRLSCGGGAWPPTLVGHTAALYLRGAPPNARPCADNPLGASESQPGYLDFSALHEALHTLGYVGSCAPHHTQAGHVSDDPRDLMYAGAAAWTPELLDVGRDDYFAHGRPNCPDLARSAFLEPLPASPLVPSGW